MKRVALALAGFSMVFITIGAHASAQIDQPSMVGTETLAISSQPEDELPLPLMIDELQPETVLTIIAFGFDANTTGIVQQCTSGSRRQCLNRLSVRSDDRGAATFQYLISNNFGAAGDEDEPCRLGAPRCTIVLRVGDQVGIVDTVFIDAAPAPGRLNVEPRRDVVIGDTVVVTASEFQPGAQLTVLVCAAPSTSGTRCGAPGPVIPLTIGDDGTAETELILDVTEVGRDRVACGRRVGCRIVVTSEQQGVRAAAVPLSFIETPGAEYTATRVIIGLTGALALALYAGWLVRSTDWAPPREADSTLIDEAEFADLDLEAAQFDEPETTRHRV